MQPGATPELHLINLNVKIVQEPVLISPVSYEGTFFMVKVAVFV